MFGLSKAHKALRKMLVDDHTLDGVVRIQLACRAPLLVCPDGI